MMPWCFWGFSLWNRCLTQGRSHQQQCLPLFVKPCPWPLQYTTMWCFDNLGGCCWFSRNLLSKRCTWLNSLAVIWPSLQPKTALGIELSWQLKPVIVDMNYFVKTSSNVSHTFGKIWGRIEKIFWINYLWPKITSLLAKNVATCIINSKDTSHWKRNEMLRITSH